MSDHFQSIIFHGADYDGWMTPQSEGGKGPPNAREVLGIEVFHHYGVTTHEAVAGTAAGDVVYDLIRTLWHPFKPEREINVTDDNHTWKVVEGEQPHWRSRVVLYKNEKAPYFYPLPGMRGNYEDGAGAKWFHEEFRVPTVGIILAEAAYCDTVIGEHEAELAACKDTVRGRKRAKDLRSLISNRLWTRSQVLKRWPQTEGYNELRLAA